MSNTHYFLSVSLISRSCNTLLFFIVYHIIACFSIWNQISRLSDNHYFLLGSLIYHLLYTHFFSLFKSTISQTSIIFIAHFYSFTTIFLTDLLSTVYSIPITFICIFHLHFSYAFLQFIFGLYASHPAPCFYRFTFCLSIQLPIELK